MRGDGGKLLHDPVDLSVASLKPNRHEWRGLVNPRIQDAGQSSETLRPYTLFGKVEP